MQAAGRCVLGAVALLCLLLLCKPAAASQRLAVVYNASAGDQGFNRLIVQGIDAFEREQGVRVRRILHANQQALSGSELERVLQSGSVDALLFATPTLGAVVDEVSRRFPTLRLEVDDAYEDGGDDRATVRFRFEEGAYLAGIAAAQVSRSGRLGFVGVDFSGLRRFGCAFAEGARRVDPDIQVDARLITPSADAFGNPELGRELALQLIDAGADVLLHAAGGTGLGLLDAAAERSVMGIGVDANQNDRHPGSVLTSVLKRMDVAVRGSLQALQSPLWRTGPRSVGLAEGAVDLAFDQHNAGLLDAAAQRVLSQARFELIAGDLAPGTLDAAGRCSDLSFP